MKRIKKADKTPVAPKAHAVAEARPAPIVRNDWEYTRLKVGDVVALYGREFVVDYVNTCRARCIPLSKKQVSYTTVSGKTVEFESEEAGKNISPNSDIPILKRLGPSWRKKFDKNNNQTESSS
jgi:hypothetical protein